MIISELRLQCEKMGWLHAGVKRSPRFLESHIRSDFSGEKKSSKEFPLAQRKYVEHKNKRESCVGSSLFDLELYLLVGGEYTNFGETCGDQVEIDVYCVEYFESSIPISYGDDPNLDKLYDECAQGNGDSCDMLFLASWGSEEDEYFQFAATCGNTEDFDVIPRCGSYVLDFYLE